MPADPIRLTLPLDPEEAKELRAGQACCFPARFSRCAMQATSVCLLKWGMVRATVWLDWAKLFSMQVLRLRRQASRWRHWPYQRFANGLRGSSSYGLWPWRNGGQGTSL